MDVNKYKVLPTGGSLLSIHYVSLHAACFGAKDLVANQGYESARVIIRFSEVELVSLRRGCEIEFPCLDELVHASVSRCMNMVKYLRNKAKERTGDDLINTFAQCEKWEVEAHTVGPKLRAQQGLCRMYLG